MTRDTQIELVNQVLEEIKKTSFIPSYKATNEEALAMLISRHSDYDGASILEASALALEDANFHPECQTLLEMAGRLR